MKIMALILSLFFLTSCGAAPMNMKEDKSRTMTIDEGQVARVMESYGITVDRVMNFRNLNICI